MYSGTRKLGYPQNIMVTNEWYQPGNDETGSDVDMISVAMYSPPAGYPPQRISEYDTPLAEHQTLNGVGLGTMTRQDAGAFTRPLLRTSHGEQVRRTSLQPRHAQRRLASFFTAPMMRYYRH